jgi:hypothetical protein
VRGDWTDLLAGALAHDIGNLAHGLSSAQRLTRAGAGEDFDVTEWAAFVERDVDRLRKLGVRLRALATAREVVSSVRLDDACAGALAELGSDGGRVRRAASLPFDSRVRGSSGAVSAAIVSLLEHALAASPSRAQIDLAVREAGAGAVIVAITAPEASALAAIERAPLDALLDADLRARRGDLSLVLAGAVAEALGGAVHVASDPKRGLVLELQLVAAPA